MGTQAPERPVALQFKAAAAAEVEAPGRVEVRADEGIVEAIVSVTGIEDNVQDVIEPGAYKETLVKRRPKVIWHHNWDQPIGRVLHIEELMPGDSRLPRQTKDGRPWPAEAGGLLATMQFNLKSERGREAFEAVRFYSETGECEWSIGYQVPATKSTRDKGGVRHIKAIDLFELSYVLFGAASETGTLGLKAAVDAARLRMEFKQAAGVLPAADDARVTEAPKMSAAERLAYVAEKSAQDVVDTTTPSSPAPTTPTPGPDGPVGDPTTTDPSVPGEDGGSGGEPSATPPIDPPQKEVGPSPTPQDDSLDDDGAVALAIASHAEATDPDDWEKWADELDDADRALVGLFADVDGGADSKALAAALTFTGVNGSLQTTGDTGTLTGKAVSPGGRPADDSPVGTPGGQQNWVDKAGGLPRYIRMVAHALIRRGMSASRAIATAVATMKRWASGVGDVSAKVRAAAAKAVAEWESMKARANATKALAWSPWAETGEYASVKNAYPTSHNVYPRLEGTFEERLDSVCRAVCDALQEPYEQPEGGSGPSGDGMGMGDRPDRFMISVDGTWPDRVIATRMDPDSGDRESFEMNYVVAPDGEITLSEPQPVTLTVYVEDAETGGQQEPNIPMGDMLQAPEAVESAVGVAKALLALSQQTEVKSGRVLSGVNETRLKAAVESLVAVLRAAGVEIDTKAPGQGQALAPTPDMETTARKSDEVHRVPTADVEATLARLRG